MSKLEILKIEARTEITDDGVLLRVIQVSFKTAKGVRSEVRLPPPATNEEIKAAVQAEAARLDSLIGPL